jgi:hypothetical protein
MKKHPQLSFRHFDGAGPLSIYWFGGPYGDAIEADEGAGVGWFSPTGDVLGVEFDNIEFNKDHQTLKFGTHCSVTVSMKNGRSFIQCRASRSPKRAA